MPSKVRCATPRPGAYTPKTPQASFTRPNPLPAHGGRTPLCAWPETLIADSSVAHRWLDRGGEAPERVRLGVIDLHTHSVVSDGTDQPAAVVELAARAGCGAVALTDHDSQAGTEEAGARALSWASSSCRVRGELRLPGTSAHSSSTSPSATAAPSPRAGPVAPRPGNSQSGHGRAPRRAGHPHHLRRVLARPRARRGWAGPTSGRSGAPRRRRVDPRRLRPLAGRGQAGPRAQGPGDALGGGALARSSGGVAVLAHPYSLNLEPDDLADAVAELAGDGFAGIEAIYGVTARTSDSAS